jgi:hypothetical protein
MKVIRQTQETKAGLLDEIGKHSAVRDGLARLLDGIGKQAG